MEGQDNFFYLYAYVKLNIPSHPLLQQDVPYYFKITTDFAISEKIGSDL
jgi:hypothetical protein